MFKRKKLTVILVMLVLLLFGLFGLSCTCGSNGDSDTTDDDINGDADDTNDDINDDADDDTDDDMDDDVAEYWQVSVISSDQYMGYYISIAVDSQDKPHITYLRGALPPDGGLYYIKKTNSGWETSKITVGGVTELSLALDSNDKAHTVGSSHGVIKYATNTPGSWQEQIIYSPSNGSEFYSIDADSNNKIHTSFFECTARDPVSGSCEDGHLMYMTNKAKSWSYEIVDDYYMDIRGYYTSIAVDSNSKVHISYINQSEVGEEARIMYATNVSGAWIRYVVEESVKFSSDFYSTSIAVDQSGKVHIGYGSYNKLKYATNSSGEWQSYVVDDIIGSYWGWVESSIAVDHNNKIHLAYHPQNCNCLKYATNKSGSWETYTVDESSKFIGAYVSLDIDSEGYAHIAYFDGENKLLKYATNRPPE